MGEQGLYGGTRAIQREQELCELNRNYTQKKSLCGYLMLWKIIKLMSRYYFSLSLYVE